MAREPLPPGFHVWAIRDGRSVDLGRICSTEAGAVELAARASEHSRRAHGTLGIRYEAHPAGQRPTEPSALSAARYVELASRESSYVKRPAKPRR